MTDGKRRHKRRREDRLHPKLAFGGYILLVVLSCVALYRVEDGRKDAESRIAAAIREDRVNTCERGNELRLTLRQILNQSVVPRPGVSRERLARQREFVRSANERLRDRDCSGVSRDPRLNP